MKKPNLERLETLYTFFTRGKRLHKKFSFGFWNKISVQQQEDIDDSWYPPLKVTNVCGTAGCLLGEAPGAFPKHWRFHGDEVKLIRGGDAAWVTAGAEKFFTLNGSMAEHLFIPDEQKIGRNLGKRATDKQVAANLRAFIDLAKNDWLKFKVVFGDEDYDEDME